MTRPCRYLSRHYRALFVIKKKTSCVVRGPYVRYYLYSREPNKAGNARLCSLQDFLIGSFVFKHLTGTTASVYASRRAANAPRQLYFTALEPFLSWEWLQTGFVASLTLEMYLKGGFALRYRKNNAVSVQVSDFVYFRAFIRRQLTAFPSYILDLWDELLARISFRLLVDWAVRADVIGKVPAVVQQKSLEWGYTKSKHAHHGYQFRRPPKRMFAKQYCR